MTKFARKCPSCGSNAVAAEKCRLLERYAKMRPVQYLQLAGFTDAMAGQPPADVDDAIFSWVSELSNDGTPVRVMVRAGTGHDAALRSLEGLLQQLRLFCPDAAGLVVEGPEF